MNEGKVQGVTKLVEEFKFNDGCMWEGDLWKILINHECSEYGGGRPCRHCHSVRDKIHTRHDKSQYIKKAWICPRIIVAYNEGTFNSTGVCLDCVLDAAASLDLMVHLDVAGMSENKITWHGWIRAHPGAIHYLREAGVTGKMIYNEPLRIYEYCDAEGDEIVERLMAEFPGFWPGCFTGVYCDGAQLPPNKQKYWHVGSDKKYWPEAVVLE